MYECIGCFCLYIWKWHSRPSFLSYFPAFPAFSNLDYLLLSLGLYSSICCSIVLYCLYMIWAIFPFSFPAFPGLLLFPHYYVVGLLILAFWRCWIVTALDLISAYRTNVYKPPVIAFLASHITAAFSTLQCFSPLRLSLVFYGIFPSKNGLIFGLFLTLSH